MIAAGPDMRRGSPHDAASYVHPPGFVVAEDEDTKANEPFSGSPRRVFIRFVHSRLRYLPTGRTFIVGRALFVPSNPHAEPPSE